MCHRPSKSSVVVTEYFVFILKRVVIKKKKKFVMTPGRKSFGLWMRIMRDGKLS